MKNLIKFSVFLFSTLLVGCFAETSEVEDSTSKEEGVSFNIPTELKEYYKDLTYTTDATELKRELKAIISNYDNQEYTQRHRYLYKADADLNNAEKVVLVYSGEKRDKREYVSGTNPHDPQTFNTEHIYPQSLIKKQKRIAAISDLHHLRSCDIKINKKRIAAISDLHHLRSCDIKINNKRGNKPFADGSGKYKDLGKTWFPGDEWKGDVARMGFLGMSGKAILLVWYCI